MNTRARGTDQVVLPSRRLGHFLVAVFGGVCALLGPRLVTLLEPRTGEHGVLISMTPTYAWSAAVFSLVIGGVVTILEWQRIGAPADTFMLALGVPALLSGALSTTAGLRQADLIARELQSTNDRLATTAGIQVENAAVDLEATQPGPVASFSLLPTVHAQEEQPTPTPPVSREQGRRRTTSTFGVRFVEREYWIVLRDAASEERAKADLAEIGKDYGPTDVRKANDEFFVVLGEVPEPYSDALSRAIEIKKESGGAVVPRLIRAR